MLANRVLIATAAATVLAAAVPASAEPSDRAGGEGGRTAAPEAAVTLVQAIGTAEAGTGGRAVAAGYEIEDGALAVEVDVVKDGRVLEALVDATTGKMLATEDDEEEDGGGGGE